MFVAPSGDVTVGRPASDCQVPFGDVSPYVLGNDPGASPEADLRRPVGEVGIGPVPRIRDRTMSAATR